MVLYESLWGNTAAVARAIAAGIGPSTRVAHTGEAFPEEVLGLDLLVVGGPVHGMTLPTEQSLTSAASRLVGPGDVPADVTQPLLRDWLDAMPATSVLAAAFDTRVTGFMGRGGTSTIERLLAQRGCLLMTRGEGFVVGNYGAVNASGAMLREGELARAHQWGEGLRELAAPGDAVP